MNALDIGLDEPIALPSHIAMFIVDETDRSRLLDYIASGVMREGEASLVHGPPHRVAAIRAALRQRLGERLDQAERARRIVFVNGQSDADAHVTRIVGTIRRLLDSGARAVRAVGLVGWDAPGWMAPEDYLWMEARMDAELADMRVVLVCAFDTAALPALALVYGGLDMHRGLAVNGRYAPNPLARDPRTFISERLRHLPWLAEASPAPVREPRGVHACAFFASHEEEYATLVPLIRDGLQSGDAVIQIVDPARRAERVARLLAGGVAVDELTEAGRLEFHDWDDIYVRDARFDAERQLAAMTQLLSDHPSGAQLITEMTWALGRAPGVDALIEYESRINETGPRPGSTIICTYDSARFDGALTLDVLRAHPVVIIAGAPQENGLYVSPPALVAELRARRG